MSRVLRGLTAVAACYVLALAVFAVWSPGAVKRHQIESAAFVAAAIWCVTLILARPSDIPTAVAPARSWLAPAALPSAAAALLLFWPSLSLGPLSDDYVLQSWAASGRYLGDRSSFARPAVIGLWHLVMLAGGGSGALHALNVLLHATNAWLLVLLARRLGSTLAGSLIAGAVFLCWPTQIEPVFWTAGMFDLVLTTAVLGTLLVLHGDEGAWRYAFALMLATLALMSKETAVALPLLWAITRIARRTIRAARLAGEAVVVALPCAAYLLWRVWLGLPLAGTSRLSRYVIKEQISRTFAGLSLPLTSETIAAHPFTAILLTMGVVSVVVATAWRSTVVSRRLALVGVAWALVAAAPTIGYLFIGPDLEGSRYLYLPCAGWALFVAAPAVSLPPVRSSMAFAALGIAAGCVLLFERQRLVNQWIEAAHRRDAIVAAAVSAAASGHCGEVAVAGLPARYRGAQLFNNGFAEAIAASRDRPPGSSVCRFTWTDDRLVPDSR